MTHHNMTTLLSDCRIALNKLTLHPRNVRAGSTTAYAPAAITPLGGEYRRARPASAAAGAKA